MAKKKYKKKKYTHGGSHNTPTNADKARQFRSMRPAVGENYMYDFSQPSNTQSTHLGQSFEADGKYYAIPSITNNRAPYADNIYHPQSFRQAMDAGEGIPLVGNYLSILDLALNTEENMIPSCIMQTQVITLHFYQR